MATAKRLKALETMPRFRTAMDLMDERLKPQINKLKFLQYTVLTFTEGLTSLHELNEDGEASCLNGLYEIIDDVTSAFDEVCDEMGRLLKNEGKARRQKGEVV